MTAKGLLGGDSEIAAYLRKVVIPHRHSVIPREVAESTARTGVVT